MPAFLPDASLVDRVVPSPNQGERIGVARPDILILHYTGMPDPAEALSRLCSPESSVSAHYFVFEDGRVVQSVPESRRAWHAGISSWEGATDINSRSIGIEIANPGHQHGYRDFPSVQIAAVTALCQDILARQPIASHRVLAHSDVAPLRKDDPGEKFPWETLHRAGVGLWVPPAPLETQGETLRRTATGPSVTRQQDALRRYGYGIEVNGVYDDATERCVVAFQRHFRPGRVDGRADPSTQLTLAALLARRFAP